MEAKIFVIIYIIAQNKMSFICKINYSYYLFQSLIVQFTCLIWSYKLSTYKTLDKY